MNIQELETKVAEAKKLVAAGKMDKSAAIDLVRQLAALKKAAANQEKAELLNKQDALLASAKARQAATQAEEKKNKELDWARSIYNRWDYSDDSNGTEPFGSYPEERKALNILKKYGMAS